MTTEELKAIEKLTNAVKELDYTLTAIANLKLVELSKDLSGKMICIKLDRNSSLFNALMDSIRTFDKEADL